MAGENEVQSGEQEVAAGTGSEVEQTQGQETASVETQAIDPQEYQRMREAYEQLNTNWTKMGELVNRDPAFRQELERAWKGLPPAQKQEVQRAQAVKENTNLSKNELAEIKAQMKEWRETQQREQVENLRRQTFTDVQNETAQTFKEFEANEADQAEFWKRYGEMINREVQSNMQGGMPLPQAQQRAYDRHSRNLGGEYAFLMRDRVATNFNKKAQERNNPLRGISTPADKQGTPGVMPGVKERFLSAIKNEKSAEKRAEMYVAYQREYGEPQGGMFRSTGGM